ncbi:hypothetical protein OROHE_021641 [Orobanche hederae]
MVAARVLGERYEYSYRFWIDEGILSDYRHFPTELEKPSPEIRTFVFEIRTTFMLKKTRRDEGDDQETTILDSERYGAWTQDDGTYPDPNDELCCTMGFRMLDYFIMSDEKLANEARAFANRNWVDAHYSSSSGRILPVAVDLDICTVQQDGEPIRAAADRAIKSEWMIPLDLFPVGPTPDGKKRRLGRIGLFFPRIRVEERLALMAVCPICLEEPVFGAQISSLDPCRHAFHTHCIVPWLKTCDSCPTCRSPVDLWF